MTNGWLVDRDIFHKGGSTTSQDFANISQSFFTIADHKPGSPRVLQQPTTIIRFTSKEPSTIMVTIAIMVHVSRNLDENQMFTDGYSTNDG